MNWQPFRKKPVVVQAYRTEKRLEIKTLEGTMVANPGDWIIEGTAGERYPCKPEIFDTIYEPIGLDEDAWEAKSAKDVGKSGPN